VRTSTTISAAGCWEREIEESASAGFCGGASWESEEFLQLVIHLPFYWQDCWVLGIFADGAKKYPILAAGRDTPPSRMI